MTPKYYSVDFYEGEYAALVHYWEGGYDVLDTYSEKQDALNHIKDLPQQPKKGNV